MLAIPYDVLATGASRVIGGVDVKAAALLELPFILTATGSDPTEVNITAGAWLNLPYDLVATGSDVAGVDIKAAALLDMPFTLTATGSGPADAIIRAGIGLEIPFDLVATGHGDADVAPTAGIYGELNFTALGNGREVPVNYFNILLSFNASGEVEPPSAVIEITEGVAISMQLVARYAMMLRDFMRIVSTPQTFLEQSVELWDTATIVAETLPQFSLLIQETFDITESLTVVQVIELAERLVAVGMVETLYQGVVAVLSAVMVTDGRITGGSAEGGTAGVSVQAFGPPSVEFTFTGYWKAGTIIELSYTTSAGPGFISYTLQYPQLGPQVMALFATALDAQPLVNAAYNGTSVTITAQSPATWVQL